MLCPRGARRGSGGSTRSRGPTRALCCPRRTSTVVTHPESKPKHGSRPCGSCTAMHVGPSTPTDDVSSVLILLHKSSTSTAGHHHHRWANALNCPLCLPVSVSLSLSLCLCVCVCVCVCVSLSLSLSLSVSVSLSISLPLSLAIYLSLWM